MKVILTGATGYVGEGILLDCLENPKVEEILSISRRPSGISHNKLKELLVPDLMAVDNSKQQLEGYDAVFFCAGTSSVGKTEEIFKKIAADIPLHLAEVLPDRSKMTFIFVTGAGTDINGKQMWQRVKGATEKKLSEMGFKATFGYRVAHMTPVKGQKSKQILAQKFGSLFSPLGRLLGITNSLSEVARSMVNISEKGYPKEFITPKDVRKIAEEA